MLTSDSTVAKWRSFFADFVGLSVGIVPCEEPTEYPNTLALVFTTGRRNRFHVRITCDREGCQSNSYILLVQNRYSGQENLGKDLGFFMHIPTDKFRASADSVVYTVNYVALV